NKAWKVLRQLWLDFVVVITLGRNWLLFLQSERFKFKIIIIIIIIIIEEWWLSYVVCNNMHFLCILWYMHL
ncbi:MAG: hypothetical protein N7Q72_06055, partial [Spiroplasma sp. Tabriz.8]|nr:hypothetical protein [Spiroplasma sp. Tabriz.8]